MHHLSTKVCTVCGRELSLDSFYTNGQYHRPDCKDCNDTRRKTRASYRTKRPPPTVEQKTRINESDRRRRKDPARLAYTICRDAKKMDRKRKMGFALTIEGVAALLEEGCRYCGERDLRMTLDRIDNSKGHTFDNVVPACIRCNYTRRAMPYDAWLVVAEGMRRAKERGLFGEWTGRVR